jgi:hypothetical protein
VVGDHLDGHVGRGVAVDAELQFLDALPLALFTEDVQADFFEAIAGIESRAAPPCGAGNQSVTLFDFAGMHPRTLSEHRRARRRVARRSVD